MTQPDVARAMGDGATATDVSRWERELVQIPDKRKPALAKALRCRPEDLISGASGMEESQAHYEFETTGGWTKELSGLETLAGILIAREEQNMEAGKVKQLAELAARMADAGDKRISMHLVRHVLEHHENK